MLPRVPIHDQQGNRVWNTVLARVGQILETDTRPRKNRFCIVVLARVGQILETCSQLQNEGLT